MWRHIIATYAGNHMKEYHPAHLIDSIQARTWAVKRFGLDKNFFFPDPEELPPELAEEISDE